MVFFADIATHIISHGRLMQSLVSLSSSLGCIALFFPAVPHGCPPSLDAGDFLPARRRDPDAVKGVVKEVQLVSDVMTSSGTLSGINPVALP
jgi:hypothetical protein